MNLTSSHEHDFWRKLFYFLLLLLAVGVYFYGLGSDHIATNGDELLYAQIARATALSGHWLPLVSPIARLQNTKPPLLFWQGILSTHWAHNWTLFTLRWPSVLYTLLTALLIGLIGKELFKKKGLSLHAALIFLSFFGIFRYGRCFLTSAPEIFWLSLPCLLMLAWPRPMSSWKYLPLLGIIIGTGLLYKSFMLVVPLLTVISWWSLQERAYQWKVWIRADLGKIIFLTAVALGVFSLWFLLDPNPEAILKQFILKENFGKFDPGTGSYLYNFFIGNSSIWRNVIAYPLNAGLLAPAVVALFILPLCTIHHSSTREGSFEMLKAFSFIKLTRIFHTDLLRRSGSQMDAALSSKFSSGSMYSYSRRQTSSLALPYQPLRPPRHDQYEISGLKSFFKSLAPIPLYEKRLWMWLVTIFIIFSLPNQRDERYLLLGMPPLALLLSIYWNRIPRLALALSLFAVAVIATGLGGLGLLLEHHLGSSSWGPYHYPLGYWVIIFGTVIFSLLGIYRATWTRAFVLPGIFLLYFCYASFLWPFDGPMGHFNKASQDLARYKRIWVPINFNAREESYRFLLPNAVTLIPYDYRDSITIHDMQQHVPRFIISLPLNDQSGEDLHEGILIGRRLNLIDRFNAQETRAMLLGNLTQYLFHQDLLIEGKVMKKAPVSL